MMIRPLFRSKTVSYTLRIFSSLLFLSLLAVVFYLYTQEKWRDIVDFYKYFTGFQELKNFITSFGPLQTIIFVVIQSLQVVIAPVPGEVTGFLGGVLFGKAWGLVLGTVGLTLGSIAAFQIARLLGRRFVENVVKKELMDRFDYFIEHKGLHLSFLMFLIPGFPKDALCYLLGLTHMRFADFLVINVFGRLPGTLVLVLQGDALRQGRYQHLFILALICIIFSTLIYLGLEKIIHRSQPLAQMLHLRKRIPGKEKLPGSTHNIPPGPL